MTAVARSDEIASEFMRGAVLLVAQQRRGAVCVMDRDVGGLINGRRAGGRALIAEVLGQFGLAIDHDLFAAGQVEEVNPMARPVEGEIETLMRQALATHPGAELDLIEEIDGALFEDAGANPGLDIGAALALQNDGLDADSVEQMSEQEARRAGADDGDLGAVLGHCLPGELSVSFEYCYRRELSPKTSLD